VQLLPITRLSSRPAVPMRLEVNMGIIIRK
jgi:hypothetical protein